MTSEASKWRSINGHPSSGWAAVVGGVLALSLFGLSVGRHPESLEQGGRFLLVLDIALVLVCGIAGIGVARQRIAKINSALEVGAFIGAILGVAHVAHHLAEFVAPPGGRVALLLLGAGHMLLIFAFFCITGSVAWERTRSFGMAMLGGVWCALLSVLVLIAFAFSLNLLFEAHAERQLQTPFRESGMSDPGAFLVKNSLQAASEGLVRMPVMALILSFAGALANAWMSRRARLTAVIVAWLIPVVFAVGAASLWYADALERAARPPFVMFGLLLAGVSLAGVHSVWSALRRTKTRVDQAGTREGA